MKKSNLISWFAVVGLCALGAPSVAFGQAKDVDCRRCVDKSDIAKKSISSSRLDDRAVSENKIRDGAVTETKLSSDAVRAVSASATAHVGQDVDVPQTQAEVMLSLNAQFSDGSSGLIEVPFDGRLMATVSMRIEPTGNATNLQCRLFRQTDGVGAIGAMTNYIPMVPVPLGGVATTIVGTSLIDAGVYDVLLRCSAGFSGQNAPPLAVLKEAQLIVWAVAD